MIKNINRKEFDMFGDMADLYYENAKYCPAEWTRCEWCGKLLYAPTAIYCDNECRSKKYAITEEERAKLKGYLKDTDDMKICFDCEYKGCPICGGHDLSR